MQQDYLSVLYNGLNPDTPTPTPTPPRQPDTSATPQTRKGLELVLSPRQSDTCPDTPTHAPTSNPTPIGVLAQQLGTSDRTIQRWCKTILEVFGWQLNSPFNPAQVQLLGQMSMHCSDRWEQFKDKTGIDKRLSPRDYCQQLAAQIKQAHPDSPIAQSPTIIPQSTHDLVEVEDDLADLIAGGDPTQAIAQDLEQLDEQDEQLADTLAQRLDPKQRKARVISMALAKLQKQQHQLPGGA